MLRVFKISIFSCLYCFGALAIEEDVAKRIAEFCKIEGSAKVVYQVPGATEKQAGMSFVPKFEIQYDKDFAKSSRPLQRVVSYCSAFGESSTENKNKVCTQRSSSTLLSTTGYLEFQETQRSLSNKRKSYQCNIGLKETYQLASFDKTGKLIDNKEFDLWKFESQSFDAAGKFVAKDVCVSDQKSREDIFKEELSTFENGEMKVRKFMAPAEELYELSARMNLSSSPNLFEKAIPNTTDKVRDARAGKYFEGRQSLCFSNRTLPGGTSSCKGSIIQSMNINKNSCTQNWDQIKSVLKSCDKSRSKENCLLLSEYESDSRNTLKKLRRSFYKKGDTQNQPSEQRNGTPYSTNFQSRHMSGDVPGHKIKNSGFDDEDKAYICSALESIHKSCTDNPPQEKKSNLGKNSGFNSIK